MSDYFLFYRYWAHGEHAPQFASTSSSFIGSGNSVEDVKGAWILHQNTWKARLECGQCTRYEIAVYEIARLSEGNVWSNHADLIYVAADQVKPPRIINPRGLIHNPMATLLND